MLSSSPELGDVSDVTMVVAARATSAAPMFFKPQIVKDGDRERMLVDGGLYVNSPAVLGYLLGGQAAARDDAPARARLVGHRAHDRRRPHSQRRRRAQMRDASAAARTLLEAVATGSGRLVHDLPRSSRRWRALSLLAPADHRRVVQLHDGRLESRERRLPVPVCTRARLREPTRSSSRSPTRSQPRSASRLHARGRRLGLGPRGRAPSVVGGPRAGGSTRRPRRARLGHAVHALRSARSSRACAPARGRGARWTRALPDRPEPSRDVPAGHDGGDDDDHCDDVSRRGHPRPAHGALP